MPSLGLGLGTQFVRPLATYILDGRVLDLTNAIFSSSTTVSDKSGQDNDATLYSGRPVSTDGATDKAIQANATAAGSANYYLTGKVRPTGTSCRVQINDTASGEDDITGLSSGVWNDFTSATFTGQTPSNVVVGWSSHSGFLAVAADWSDVKLVNATTGATVARYQLNESADGDLDGYPALDSSGNGYHGTHTGCAGGTGETTILQTAGMDWNKDATTYAGKTILVPESDSTAGEDCLGNAIANPRPTADTWNLFGDGEYGVVADADSLDVTTQFTIEVWVDIRKAIPTEDASIFSHYNASGNQRAIWVRIAANGNLFITLSANGTTSGLITESVAANLFPLGVFCLQIVYNAGTLTTYANTSMVYTSATAPTSIHATTADLCIGSLTNSGGFERFLDRQVGSVKFYNRALTADEVLRNYNAQKSKFGL